MADLELIGLDEDGEHVLLRASDGTRFRLAISEPLRAAVRRDRPQLEQLRSTAQGSLPPREIQARIRSGMTAEQVAESAEISVSQVRRYEGPVLAERAFMATQAQNTRVGRDSDAPSLGDLVTDRLAARGIETSSLAWDSFRPASGPWQVQVEFDGEQGSTSASWSFDPQTKALSALDEQSRWLSETAIPDEPVRRHLSPVRSRVFDIESDPLEPNRPAPTSASAAEPDETSRILAELKSRRGVRQEVEGTDSSDAVEPPPGSEELRDSTEEHDQFEGFGPQQTFAFDDVKPDPHLEQTRPRDRSSDGSATQSGTTNNVFSFSDGPAGRRRASGASAASSTEVTSSASAAGTDETPTASEDRSGSAPTEVEAPAKEKDVPPPLERVKPGRKGRPKVPSWDEIVFGAKPE